MFQYPEARGGMQLRVQLSNLVDLLILQFQEISDDPQMFVGGASRFDVKQGVLGWYIIRKCLMVICLKYNI